MSKKTFKKGTTEAEERGTDVSKVGEEMGGKIQRMGERK